MGSGKSTVGPLLAGEMDRPFYDLDELIEKEQERSISDIFESQGEESFRQLESHQLFQSEHFTPCVMALGGGTFASKPNRDFISKHGLSVWLKIPIQLARERCRDSQHRPLAKGSRPVPPPNLLGSSIQIEGYEIILSVVGRLC
jgi:shikimate kinase